jgi:two-component system, OmpR family, KDP operon response regulator KdpE
MPIVLIAEDDQGIQDVLRFLAEANGMQVIAANTCDVAIREAESHRPDLAIVDLGLPDRDGVQFIRTIRAWSRMPIIVLTARTLESQRRMAFEAGANDYVIKPFSAPELLARMRALLPNDSTGELRNGA